MTDPRRLDRLRGHFHTGETPIPKPDCLDAHTVAALADGTLDPVTRGRALAHVATCALCRRAIASVAAALADAPITHEIEVVEGRRRPRSGRLLRITIPLAAAATALLFLWSPADDRPPRHRGPPQAGTIPVLVSPRGVVADLDDLRWRNVAGADRYRVTVFESTGTVLYETQVQDTVAALPDSVRLTPGRSYLWKVEARTGWERWSASDLVEFIIARGPPQ